ncbi:hypothetical protein GC170_15990 [bacterium]|nr:hypothetical protein [bacterium]
MAQFHFPKLKKWFDTLNSFEYRARLAFRFESQTEKAQVYVEVEPYDPFDLDDSMNPQLPPVNFTIHAIEPKRIKTRFSSLEIQLEQQPICFRTDDPELWSYENRAEIICNSPVNCAEVFRNVVRRMHGHASSEDIFRYLSPIRNENPPFWLGGFPASLFRHVRETLQEMNVSIFVPSEPKAVEMPVLLKIGDDIRIIARDFEIDIPGFETLDALFGKR